ADGKRPWFDRLAPDRIYMRHRYREAKRPIAPDRFVHDYRGRPIRNFYFDLKSLLSGYKSNNANCLQLGVCSFGEFRLARA
ncbi:MAG: hypothetical protein ABIH03_16470, partial [Pseudomonadota bacterium]